jgi:hypothetical protein
VERPGGPRLEGSATRTPFLGPTLRDGAARLLRVR